MTNGHKMRKGKRKPKISIRRKNGLKNGLWKENDYENQPGTEKGDYDGKTGKRNCET